MTKMNQGGFALLAVTIILTVFSAIVFSIIQMQGSQASAGIKSVTTSAMSVEGHRLAQAIRLATYEQWLSRRVAGSSWSAGDTTTIINNLPNICTGWSVTGANSLLLDPIAYVSVPGGTIPNGMTAKNIMMSMNAWVDVTPPSGSPKIYTRQAIASLPAGIGFCGTARAYFDAIPYTVNISCTPPTSQVTLTNKYNGFIYLTEIPPSEFALSGSGSLDLSGLPAGTITGPVAAAHLTGGAGVNLTGTVQTSGIGTFTGSLNGNTVANTLAGQNGFSMRGANEAGVSTNLYDTSVSRSAVTGWAVAPVHLCREGLANSATIPVAKQALYGAMQPYYAVPVAARVLTTVSTPVNIGSPATSVAYKIGDGGSLGALPAWLTLSTLPLASVVGGNALIATLDPNAIPLSPDGVARAFVGGYDAAGNPTAAMALMINDCPSVTPAQVEIITPNKLVIQGNLNTTSAANIKIIAASVGYGWSGARSVTVTGSISGANTNQLSTAVNFKTVAGDTPSATSFTQATSTVSTGDADFLSAFQTFGSSY